jgi:hypothetical protein
MSVFNRSFLALLTLAWCAALALGAYLIWDQSRNINFDGSWLQFRLDLIFETQAERILATIATAALALPALLLLAMELTPSGARHSGSDRRRDESYGALQAKVDTLQKRLDDEQSHRRDVEKDFGRERVNAETVRSTAGQPTATEGRPPPRRRGWHLLPRRS